MSGPMKASAYNNDKRTIDVQLGDYISVSELAWGTMDDAIKVMERYRDDHAGKVIVLKAHRHAYSGSEQESLFLYEQRLETDEEHAARLAKEAEHRTAQEDRDRAEFERLQAKFGNKYGLAVKP